MIIATASQIKNAFGKYLDLARIKGDVQVVRYGRIVAKIVAITEEDNKDSIEEHTNNNQ